MATDHGKYTEQNLSHSLDENGSETSRAALEDLLGDDVENLESDLRDLLSNDPDGSLCEPTLGKYLIREILAQSSQSVVFKALDPDLQRHVVIKVYCQLSADEKNRLFQEGRALAQLTSSRVVRCYGVEEFGGLPGLIMEYVQGCTLDEYFRRRNPLPASEVARITAEIAFSVSEIHGQGLVHCDLKPENVMIDNGRGIKLIDFGLCHSIGKLETQTPAGTPGFLSPEIANDEVEDFGQGSDIFGVCAILYFLLNGQAPFAAETKLEALQKSQAGQVNEMPKGRQASRLGQICLKGLRRNPTDRFPDAIQIVEILERFQKRHLRRLLIVAGLLTFALMIGFGINRVFQKGQTRQVPFLSSSELANLKSEISIQVKFLHCVGNQLKAVVPGSDGVVTLAKNGRYFILVNPEESCFVRIFSFEYDGEWKIDPIFPSWEAGDSTAQIQPLNFEISNLPVSNAYADADQTTLRRNFIEIVPDAVSERDEYIYVFTSTNSSQSEAFSDSTLPVLMRGVSRRSKGNRLTQLIEAYRVE